MILSTLEDRYQGSEGTCCLHLQGKVSSHRLPQYESLMEETSYLKRKLQFVSVHMPLKFRSFKK
jgi:hypothetical protein